jgi:aldehyde:ferredoxin oxidoreductase
MMLGGYMGKLLFVDLSKAEIKEEAPDEKLYRDFMGGYGLGARIIYSRQPGGVDPLGRESIIGFVTGPLTGMRGMVMAPRFTVVGKSPLTGGWGDANSGGYFGPYLKFAGYDAVFFSGVSPKPVYLFIDNGKAELRDAGHLWGKDSRETDEGLKSELGGNVAVACIGPAGESLSLISSVMHDVGSAAARSGLGAVMGSKRLKAVAARGTMAVPIPNKEKVTQVSKEFLGQYMGDYYERFKQWGTCGDNANAALNGDSPVKNWAGVGTVDFPNAKAIGGDAMIALQERKHGCLWCPIRCKGIMKAGSGKDFPYEAGSHKPEYETSAAFGMLLLNDNLESIVKANDICNRYGLDTISAGATVAFAVECYENGIISKQDTGGIELGWGKPQAIVAMTEKVAKREGFGAVLADGVKRAAERIGKGAERYAVHSGGQELAMHDPKLMSIFATAYECDSAPGRHTSGAMDAVYSSIMRIMDASGMCMLQWTSAPQMDMAKIISAAWGWEVSMQDLMKTGERISHIRQAFNAREGIDPQSRKISPGRPIGNPPLRSGPTANVTVDAEGMRVKYFEGMGWDLKTGKPSRERLMALGLDDVAQDLWPASA